MTTTTYRRGDRVRSRIHRTGILPISPGDAGTVTGAGIRNYTDPYILVTLQVRGGAVHTTFSPGDGQTPHGRQPPNPVHL
jgi:hypothetical protein